MLGFVNLVGIGVSIVSKNTYGGTSFNLINETGKSRYWFYNQNNGRLSNWIYIGPSIMLASESMIGSNIWLGCNSASYDSTCFWRECEYTKE